MRKTAVSEMADSLIGSEIIKLGNEINERIAAGERIYNYTIGDFDPKVFPIPQALEDEIVKAYQQKQTNYPPANGIGELRQTVATFMDKRLGLKYSADEILITSGARPAIYAAYITLLDKGDKVIFPTPSWNNNHYCHLSHARGVAVETKPENNFLPTAEELAPHIGDATLLALCSPLNPTGTSFTRKALYDICALVVEENTKRAEQHRKPLYLLYDQIYWVLTYGDTVHYDPVRLFPELRPYTVYIDGLSKSFAATGVRVGWTFGPREIVDKMKAILSHIGAWAPKAEQIASARYMNNDAAVDQFLDTFKQNIQHRLQGFYNGIQSLKKQGYKVDAIAPQSAIYLTVQIALKGMKTPSGETLQNTAEIAEYLLHDAKLAIVPFYAFGSSRTSDWFRLSVGTCKDGEIEASLQALKQALDKLS
jgi:aspartate aminotransferase